MHMKFGKLGTTQDCTPQNRNGPSLLSGWSSHGTLQDSYVIITYGRIRQNSFLLISIRAPSSEICKQACRRNLINSSPKSRATRARSENLEQYPGIVDRVYH